MALDFKQTQFKHLEEANRTCANDHSISFNKFVRIFSNGHVIFDSHIYIQFE